MVIFVSLWLIILIVAIVDDPQKRGEERIGLYKQSPVSTTVVRNPIDPTLIQPYTESELRRKVKDISTNESVVYNAGRFIIEHPTSKSANQTWQRVRDTRKPRMGQQRFWACMHLADHDFGK